MLLLGDNYDQVYFLMLKALKDKICIPARPRNSCQTFQASLSPCLKKMKTLGNHY